MKAYPMEYRQRVVELSAQGWTKKAIREALGVSRAWVDSIKRRQKNGKSLAIRSSANHRTSLAERQGERIAAQVQQSRHDAHAAEGRSGPVRIDLDDLAGVAGLGLLA